MAALFLLMLTMGLSTQILVPRFLEILSPFSQLVPMP
jgi:hypothetical protein